MVKTQQVKKGKEKVAVINGSDDEHSEQTVSTMKEKEDTVSWEEPSQKKEKAKKDEKKEKWENKPFIAGRVFLFKELLDVGWNLEEHTDSLWWTSILKMEEPIYYGLVRKVYATIVVHKEELYLESTLKGVSMVLTPESIAKALVLRTMA